MSFDYRANDSMNPENPVVGPVNGQSAYVVPQYQVVVSWPPVMGGMSFLAYVPPKGDEQGAEGKTADELTPSPANPTLKNQADGGIQWRTKRDMAVHLRCDIRTITKYMKRRVLPYVKIGRVVRFDLTECDQAMLKFKRRSRFED